MARPRSVCLEKYCTALRPILVHLIKIKLADEAYGSHIHEFLPGWAYTYVPHWKAEVRGFFSVLAERLISILPASSNKEKIYLEALKDEMPDVAADWVSIVTKVISRHPHKQEILTGLRDLQACYYRISPEPWWKGIEDFFQSISPSYNQTSSFEEFTSRFDDFLKTFSP